VRFGACRDSQTMTEFGWTTDVTPNLSHVKTISTTGGGGEVHEVFPYVLKYLVGENFSLTAV